MKLNLLKFTKMGFLMLSLVVLSIACQKTQKHKNVQMVKKSYFKLSLAEWSIHKAIISEKFDPVDFAQKANEMGFKAIEYVSQLYTNYLKKGADSKLALQNLLDTLKLKSEKYNVKNLGIMVDGEGDLSSPDEEKRLKAVENHKKWIDAGAFLGCYYVRVNLFGSDDPKIWVNTSTKSLKQLATYAKTKGINLIVENHGYLSANIPYLVQVMKKVNMPNCGLLPDFGGFCLKRESNKRWDAPCIEEYDRYKGIKEMVPYAKVISAKCYDFNKKGDETLIDYYKMLQIIKDGGFKGYLGVEFEGDRLSEDEGIIAAKKLILKVESQLK